MPLQYDRNKLIMGFDYGKKYIGIAIGQTTTNTARPLECIINPKGKINWTQISELIQIWQPATLVVGIPFGQDQQLQSIQIACGKFLQTLSNKFNLPSFAVDETLSTWEAKKQLCCYSKQHFVKSELNKINAQAAAILLNQWINDNK